MRIPNGCAKYLVAVLFLVFGAVAFAPGLAGQDDAWRFVRADYGSRDQRTDVTDLVGDLISRGGVNGRVAVNNQTMGGDPAVGKDKTLRIFARNRRDQEREFDYKEGSFVEVGMFLVERSDSDRNRDWSERRDYQGNYDRGVASGVQVLRAFYGVQGHTVDVTDLLRSIARNGALTVNVSNRSMGGDPAIGEDKVLIVVYVYQGREQAAAVREGSTLSIP